MTAGTISSEESAGSVQRYARTAGVLSLVSILAGGFGEAYVPMALVVPRDAAATAARILASESLFRWGFAAYLVEALCDVGLTLLFYLLLRVVRQDLALLAIFFRLVGTTGFAVAQLLHFAALPIALGADYLQAFSPEQLQALALLALRVSGYGQTLFSLFYGVGSVLLGYLMYRSGFLPRVLGALLALSGVGFVAATFIWVLAPSYSSPLALVVVGFAALALTGWLLVKGVDVVKWEERAAVTRSR